MSRASMSASYDFSKLDASLDKITKVAEESTRPAAQAGIQVFYDEARARCPVSDQAHGRKGGQQFQPGNLRDSIYQAYADDESTPARSVYRTSWNKAKAFYGTFVENGTSKMAAQPFLRPAYDAARNKAAQAARRRMLADVKKALKS